MKITISYVKTVDNVAYDNISNNNNVSCYCIVGDDYPQGEVCVPNSKHKAL